MKTYGRSATAGQAANMANNRAVGCLMRGIKAEARRLRWMD